ncbi:uncharacterized protein MYCFIDRAFT_96869, partial [Pseudocercospora fijiensis CIRAD86]
TPSIRIEHQRFHSPPRYPPAAAPMAIPRTHQAPPPPLPPPAFIPHLAAGQHDPGWQWGNDPNGSDFGRPASVKAGSSLLGGACPPYYCNGGVDSLRRGSSVSTVTLTRDHDMAEAGSLTPSDEDGSLSRPPSNYRYVATFHLEQRTLEASSNTYDKQLLSRIGGPSNGPPTPKRTSVSSYTGSLQDTAQLAQAESERRSSQLRPLSMPERRQVFSGFWSEHGPPAPHSQSQTRHSSLTFDDSISQRGSYDQSMYVHEDSMEDGPMSNLNIHDRHDRSPGSHTSDEYARAGTKRRASSPPRDHARDEQRSSVSSASTGYSEICHRRSIQQLPRGSPVSRFHPNHSSLSSASSYVPRHGSLGSSLGVASIPSSATSYGSGRLSPGALSPAPDPEGRICVPYGSNKALSPNPAVAHPSHQRTLSESTQGGQQRSPVESAVHSRNGSVTHLQGTYICECCPKKPKKFDTEEELRLHESEKQYTCAYCPNRFKNKNEAERHQNSLHLRRHSWSCAALAGVEAAYHASTNGNGRDVCGYCGDEFPNPPQWDMRAEHLNHVHKFGECNQAKKFFRADHFRQHLKHSHQGTSGKWTNVLEVACMKDEPLPEKRVVTQGSQAPLPALMVSTSGLSSSQHSQS